MKFSTERDSESVTDSFSTNIFSRLRVLWNFDFASKLNLAFWFLSMFPGRVGFDTVLALKMMRGGEGTDWWTSFYWRILQLFTFNGTEVYFFTTFFYIIFWVVTFSFIDEVSLNNSTASKVKFLSSAIPVLPVFAATIQHDVIFCIGMLLLVLNEIRFQKQDISINRFLVWSLIAIPFLMTSKQGIFIFVFLIFRLFFLLSFWKTLSVGIVMPLLFVIAPSSGLDTTWTKEAKYIPLLMDIKCAVQHPEAQVNKDSWIYLETLLPKEIWLQPYSCRSIDENIWTAEIQYDKISIRKLLSVYFRLLPDHAEIYIMAHIQRSTPVLPPPFFRGPDNQVDLDYSNPIGFKTNLALQKNPPLLHPSMDMHELDIRLTLLRPLTYVGQFGIFLVNQASRYWGWGGLWLWVLLLHSLFLRKNASWSIFVRTYWSVIVLHCALFLIGISATPRHVMPTITIGLLLLCQTVVHLTARKEIIANSNLT